MPEQNKALILKSEIEKIDLGLKEFFFGDVIVESFETGNILQSPGVGTKIDIVNGVFQSLNIKQFFMVTGAPHNLDDLGKVALAFNNHDLTAAELQHFEEMHYHTFPVNITLNCLVFNSSELQKLLNI